MTIADMHTAFRVGVNKVDSNVGAGYLSEEVDLLLNQAQFFYIKDRFAGGNEVGFEQSRKVTDDLRQVVRVAPLIPVIDATTVFLGSPYEYLLPYPLDYLFCVYVEAGLRRTAHPVISSKEYTAMMEIYHAEIPYYRITQRNKPILRKPGCVAREDFFHVFCDSYSILDDGRLIYIRKPIDVSLDNSINSEMAESTHNDIVNIAISLAFSANRVDERYRRDVEEERV